MNQRVAGRAQARDIAYHPSVVRTAQARFEPTFGEKNWYA
jgi:hypothetical protein